MGGCTGHSSMPHWAGLGVRVRVGSGQGVHVGDHVETHIRAYDHSALSVHTHTRIHAFIRPYTHSCIHTPIHSHTHTTHTLITLILIHASMHPYTHTPIYSYTHTLTHIRTFTHIHTPTHTHHLLNMFEDFCSTRLASSSLRVISSFWGTYEGARGGAQHWSTYEGVRGTLSTRVGVLAVRVRVGRV